MKVSIFRARLWRVLHVVLIALQVISSDRVGVCAVGRMMNECAVVHGTNGAGYVWRHAMHLFMVIFSEKLIQSEINKG